MRQADGGGDATVSSRSASTAPRSARTPSVRTPRTPRHRVVLALLASLLATAAVAVPLGYQAYESDAGSTGTSPTSTVSTTTSTTVPPQTTAPVTAPPKLTAPSVPVSVAPSTRDRDDLAWASTDGSVGTSAQPPTTTAAPEPLEGATVHGEIVVSVGDDTIVRAEFWVDDASGVGPPDWTDDSAPFTLASATGPRRDAFNTSTLENGTHEVLVVLTTESGAKLRRISEFVVANG